MRLRTIGDTTWKSLEYGYAHDTSVVLIGDKKYYTAEGITVPTINLLSNPVDQKTNQYSNIYLTDKTKLSDFVGIKIDPVGYPRTYVSFFADSYGWVNSISPDTQCWYVKDTPETEEDLRSVNKTPVFKADVPFRQLSNELLFEVEMINELYLRVSHWDGYKRSYMTVNSTTSAMYFDFYDGKTEYNESNQIFEYSYEHSTSYITILKLVHGKYYEFKRIGPDLMLSDTTGWQHIPNSFKNVQLAEKVSQMPIYDTWVSYKPGMSQNSMEIDSERSYTDVVHNYLINTEYVYNDQNRVDLNILPLKNHMTNHHQLSRNNPFRNSKTYNSTDGNSEQETLFRDYTGISSGCNQIYGLDNIFLNYRDYTELLEFPADKLTYFHMPQDMYPYKKLNVNDSGLIESGSIAGDQPLRSDKVFKKRANYKDYSEWGDSTDEQSGTYLCTWLYWTGHEEDEPVWLDRYYNPQEYTIYDAMTARPLVELVTTFDNMVLDNPGVEEYVVFDKLSDLCFEPGVLYCYHRIGQTDINNAIDKLKLTLIQDNFNTFKTINGNNAPIVYNNLRPEYAFTGKEVGMTTILDRLLETNSFSVTYSMYSDDWSVPFGNQIFGNYNNAGFGVYNSQRYTPTYVQPGQQTKLYNTDLVEVLTLPISSIYVFKAPISDNIYIYNHDKDGSIYEYDLNGVLRERSNVPVYDGSTIPATLLMPITITHDAENMYLVYDDEKYSQIDVKTESIKLKQGIIRLPAEPHVINDGDITHAEVLSGTVYGFTDDMHYINKGIDRFVWVHKNAIYEYLVDHDVYNTVLETTDYIIKNVVVDDQNNKYVVYRDYLADRHGIYEYHMLKMDSRNELQYGKSLSTINPDLSALTAESNTMLSYCMENINGDDIGSVSLLTSRVSSLEIYNPETQQTETININIVDNTKFSPAGDLISTNTRQDDYNKYAGINNQLTDIVTRYPPDQNNTLHYKLRLINTYNKDRFEEVVSSIDVSKLDRGWHQFCYDYNADTGKALVFVDGVLISNYDMEPGKYRFSDMSIQQYVIGTASAYSGVTFNEFLKQPGYYMSKNYKIKDFRVYNKSVNYFDIKFLYRSINNIRSVKWTIPCNSRNYIDEIQHVFNHSRNTVKTNNVDINILSETITDPSLRRDLSDDLKMRLYNEKPIRSTIDNIKWYKS